MKRKDILYFTFFLFILAAIVLVIIIFREPLWDIFQSPKAIRRWVAGFGVLSPLFFILLQIIQVLLFIIPGEIPQVAGGYIFGLWLGVLYSSIGIIFGSVINFYLARLLGRAFVTRFLSSHKLQRFDAVMQTRKVHTAFFLFFLIPGIPKDFLCYVAGLSPISFISFFFLSFAGRLPGIFGSAMMGDAAANSEWLWALGVLVLATTLFLIGSLYREKIIEWIEFRFAGNKKN